MASSKKLHVVMYPWFAYGHMIPYLHLGNRLAEKGHQITYILPNKAKIRLQPLIDYPSLIHFRTITVPHVPPLPLNTENLSDLPDVTLHTHLATAFDLTRPEFESIVTSLTPCPNLVFYDLAYWIPLVVPQRIGIKFVCYNVISAHYMNTMLKLHSKTRINDNNVESSMMMQRYCSENGNPFRYLFRDCPDDLELQAMVLSLCFGKELSITERFEAMLSGCDVMAYRTCRELEEEDCEELSKDYGKPVLLAGPMVPEPDDTGMLEPRWTEWLGKFTVGSVVFCAFGSQFYFDKVQFQELLLGLEMMSLPFLLTVMPPKGYTSIEEVHPEGFKDRVGDRGMVTSEWVQQSLILAHPSVGCFVNHCGFGTMWESLLSKNQIVLIPHLPDQVLGAELLANKMKVGVQVVRGVGGWVSKESLCNAIKSVMDVNNKIGCLVKMNQQIWKAKLEAIMDDNIETFIKELQALA